MMARILIVDDTRISRELLRRELEAGGHEIIAEAANGEEGFIMYQELMPDIVTMDVTMPVLDGLSALKLIMEYDSAAKVIMITSAGQNNTYAECLLYGASDFVTKPWNADDVLFSIDQALQE